MYLTINGAPVCTVSLNREQTNKAEEKSPDVGIICGPQPRRLYEVIEAIHYALPDAEVGIRRGSCPVYDENLRLREEDSGPRF